MGKMRKWRPTDMQFLKNAADEMLGFVSYSHLVAGWVYQLNHPRSTAHGPYPTQAKAKAALQRRCSRRAGP